MSKRVIIIGGGASGMTAAIFAARAGAKVTLIEHTDRLGKKILATGNGKCNLSNLKLEESCYRSSNPDFPMKVISQFDVGRTIEFFEDLGIVIKARDGYLYPYSGQASAVLDLLRNELSKYQIKVITDCHVKEILDHDGVYKEYVLHTTKGKFDADAVILATGSKAAPSTGSDGSGYELAKNLGLRIIKPLPALVQLRCKEKFYKQISGVRTDALITLVSGGVKLAKDRGELQLTEYGISGIPVFQVSRFASVLLDQGKKVEVFIDFYPEIPLEEVKQMINLRFLILSGLTMDEFFTGWFNKKIGLLFLKLAGIEEKRPAKRVTDQEKTALLSLIKEFKTEVIGTNPFENAQIACGGVDTALINPESMEVLQKKGLYLTGELLDVDGICGGYNLQWAWSTGAIAGTHAGI